MTLESERTIIHIIFNNRFLDVEVEAVELEAIRLRRDIFLRKGNREQGTGNREQIFR